MVEPAATLAEWRHSDRPGGRVHWIQARQAILDGAWRSGVILAIGDLALGTALVGEERPRRLGNLWLDALRLVSRRRTVARDPAGRPSVLWHERFAALMLDEGGENHVASVVDLDRQPEVLDAWQRLADADPDWRRRPGPPGAPSGVG